MDIATYSNAPTNYQGELSPGPPPKVNYAIDESTIEPPPASLNLLPCPICTRTFLPGPLTKHMKVCEKTATKRRKIFDSSRQRREGTELAQFLPKNFGLPPGRGPGANIQPEPIKISPPRPSIVKKLSAEKLKPPEILKLDDVMDKPMRTQPSPKEPTPPVKPGPSRRATMGPASEQCPHCERHFGVKAYDRHVEWCKEKTRLANQTNSASLNAAKERLAARTKYKAPITKKMTTREKYSGSCGESTNSLSDGSSSHQNSKANSEERKNSMSVSMTSSFTSDGGFSDKYDPFKSAKRQLEELFSPSQEQISITDSITVTPKIKTQTLNRKTPFITSTPKSSASTISSFRRTSSLRLPKKTTIRPSYTSLFNNKKPTVQRGISDEGPISKNFMRPEEFDELPVGGSTYANDYCKSPPFVSPRQSPVKEVPVLRRDPSAILNRRNLSPSPDYPLCKTDSLAIFLKYEKEFDDTESLTEKELKDKSNNLNKRTSSGGLNAFIEMLDNKIERENSTSPIPTTPKSPEPQTATQIQPNSSAIKLAPLEHRPSLTSSKNDEIDQKLDMVHDSKDKKMINICDNLPLNVTKLSSESDLTSSSCESNATSKSNSTIKLSPSSEMGGNSNDKIYPSESMFSINSNKSNKSTAGEKRRQLRLNKDNILYNTDPDISKAKNSSDNIMNFINQEITLSRNNSKTSIKSSKTDMDMKSLFGDINLDDFISSFEDDEECPIFKDYKQLLLSRSTSRNDKFSSSSNSSTSMETSEEIHINENFNRKGDEDFKKSISCDSFLRTEDNNNGSRSNSPTLKINEHERNDSGDSTTDEPDNSSLNNQKFSENMENHNDHHSDDIDDMKKNSQFGQNAQKSQGDSDEMSSLESYPLRKNISSKLSADSAYGSLSRVTPVDRPTHPRRNNPRARQQIKDMQASMKTEPIHITLKANRIVNGAVTPEPIKRMKHSSLSSSESETILPPMMMSKASPTVTQTSIGNDVRFSKFCHECGSKFIITQAKFCMECGVKRLVLE